jgi:type IV secretory pathway VirB2 component (pilin)
MNINLDQTIAIVGIVALGGAALYLIGAESKEIILTAIGGLVGYIGGKLNS